MADTDKFLNLTGLQYFWTNKVKPLVTSAISNVIVQVTGQATDKVMSQKTVTDDLNTRAKTDGVYETLVAGTAMNLTGRGSVGAQFYRRTTGGNADIGSGTAQITKLKGNSIVWNQLIEAKPTISVYGFTGLTGTITSDGLVTLNGTIVFNEGSTGGGIITGLGHAEDYEGQGNRLNHVCLIRAKYVGGSTTSTGFCFANPFKYDLSERLYLSKVIDGTEPDVTLKLDFFDTTTKDSKWVLHGMGFQNGDTFNNFQFYLNFFDLTQMFGFGKELTKDEFKTMFPLDYYTHNAGTILNFKGEKIKTDGFNQMDSQGKIQALPQQYQIVGTYTSITQNGNTITPGSNGIFTPARGEVVIAGFNDTTCVHFVWSGVRNGEYEEHWDSELALNVTTIKSNNVAIFPNGMQSAGSAHDELVTDSDGYARKAIKRIGSIDLGTLNWVATTQEEELARAIVATTFLNTNDGNTKANILCKDYTTDTFTNQYFTDKYGKTICVQTENSNTYLSILDANFVGKTSAEVKTLLNGVILYYEVITPTEYTLDSSISMNYQEDDFGTETSLPSNGIVPTTSEICMNVKYPLNTADTIRNLPRKYASIQSTGASSTIGNLLSALVNAGILESAIINEYEENNQRYNFTIEPKYRVLELTGLPTTSMTTQEDLDAIGLTFNAIWYGLALGKYYAISLEDNGNDIPEQTIKFDCATRGGDGYWKLIFNAFTFEEGEIICKKYTIEDISGSGDIVVTIE